MTDTIQDQLQQLITRESHKANTHAVLLGVQSRDDRVDFTGAAGAATPQSPYFIASITKMYTTAVLMQLVDERRLDLDAPLTDYLPDDLLDGIHVYNGTDYSHRLKVYQLIHQTSGLADYFEGKRKDGTRLTDDIKQGQDQAYNLTDVLATVREMPPAAAPDSAGGRKSHYSDTNYQLLGAIIEAITSQPLASSIKSRIAERLGLSATYLYDCHAPADGPQPLSLYFKDRQVALPGTMTSERGAGAVVSTLPDSLRFLRAYFDGELFDAAHFSRMLRWNALFFPMQYGYGLMRFRLPRLMTLFRYTPELIGHSGSNASFAFHAPAEGLYIAGTFNHADKPARPFSFMLRVAAAVM